MKALVLSLFLLPTASWAITLGSEQCTRTYICYNVPNDAGVTIDYINNLTADGQLLIVIDGKLYDSGRFSYSNILYAADGSSLTANLQWKVVNGPCNHSGRVTSCQKIVTLVGGTLNAY